MKFFHIADVHLGAEPDKGYPWSTDRSREIRESFQYAVQQAGREHAGLFLVAGDLFHRQPLVGELKEVNALFASIPQTKVCLLYTSTGVICEAKDMSKCRAFRNDRFGTEEAEDSIKR